MRNEQMLSIQYLKNIYNKQNLRNIERITYFTCITLIALMLLNLLSEYYNIPAFRHDELKYIDSYYGKLVSEGRWINYLFFNIIKTLDIHLIGLLNLLFFFVFSYKCLENIFEKRYAFLCALTILFIPPIHLLNEWSQTSFLSFLFLAVASFIHKEFSIKLFFFFFSIIFNGTLSHFYFLLPLLFLNKKEIYKFLLYWIIFFVIGFVFTECFTFILGGKFIKLAEWRHPHYIHNFYDIIINAKIEFYSFYNKIITKTNILLIILFFISFFIFLYQLLIKKQNLLSSCLLFLMVTISIFAMSFPAGLPVALRSDACVFLGIIFFMFYFFKNNKILLFILIISFSSHYYVKNLESFKYLTCISSIWIEGLKDISQNPKYLKGVIMLSSNEEFKEHEKKLAQQNMVYAHSTESLAAPMRWAPSAYEFGFRRIYHGQWNKSFLNEIDMNIDYSKVNFKNNLIYEYALVNNYLVLKILQ